MYNALYHYGVKGMKWGIRRYQNSDGSLTEVGKSHHALAKRGKDGIITSGKGFSIHRDKIEKYMLKRGAKHAEDFFNVGYSEKDAVRLYRDIERQYDIKNAKWFRKKRQGRNELCNIHAIGSHQETNFLYSMENRKR